MRRIFLVLATQVAGAVSWAQADFRTLGSLRDGFFPSIAYAVSGNGRVVAGMSNTFPGFEAFRWTADVGMRGLGDLPGGYFFSEAYGASADGSVIVGATDNGTCGDEGGSPMRWTQAGGMQWLGSLGGPLTYGQAMACSADGSIIVGASQSPAGIEAFRWTAITGMTSIGDLPGGPTNARATSISADGSVIVGYGSRLGTYDEGFKWTAGTGMVGLGRGSAVLDISADGRVMVGVSEAGAGRWLEDGTFQEFPRLYGTGGDMPMGCSADGSVVVGIADYNANKNSGDAFIWDPVNGIRDLNVVLQDLGVNLHGFYLYSARGISDDGRTIVGYGFGNNGQEAFYVRLPRSPLSIPLGRKLPPK